MQDFHSFMHVVSYVHFLVLLCRTWTSKTFLKFEKSPYCFEILSNQTLIKSLGGTKNLSFNEVFNSLSLCFVYLVLFYKLFQTFIIVLLVQYRYTVPIQHPVRLIVDWFFRRCIYIYILQNRDKTIISHGARQRVSLSVCTMVGQ